MAFIFVVKGFHDIDYVYLRRSLVGLKCFPQTVSINTVKSFPKVNKIQYGLTLPFNALFNNVSDGENVVYTASVWSKACLFIS